jgi:HD-GYP domain-containing protein (c-di-GMP phosphodiesterase class II)
MGGGEYDPDVYELFSKAFEHLPLATLVNGQVRPPSLLG